MTVSFSENLTPWIDIRYLVLRFHMSHNGGFHLKPLPLLAKGNRHSPFSHPIPNLTMPRNMNSRFVLLSVLVLGILIFASADASRGARGGLRSSRLGLSSDPRLEYVAIVSGGIGMNAWLSLALISCYCCRVGGVLSLECLGLFLLETYSHS